MVREINKKENEYRLSEYQITVQVISSCFMGCTFEQAFSF